MDPVFSIINSSALLPLLADAAFKGALLLVFAAIAVLALRKSSAASRHLVWCAALAGALLLPLFSLTLPSWPARWMPGWATQNHEIGIGKSESERFARAAKPTVQATATENPAPSPATARFTRATESAASPTMASAHYAAPLDARNPRLETPPIQWQTESRELETCLFFIWIMGILFASAPLLFGCRQIARLTRRCVPIADFRWQKLLRDTAAELRLRRPVTLLAGPAVRMPLTWGAWRPALLLPESAADWPESRRRLVLLHELAHIQRWDWLTQTLAYFACALYWFNPLAWLAARRMRVEREQACDDLVLRQGARPSDYADELLQFAESGSSPSTLDWAAVPMARRSSLETRVRALLDARRSRATLTRGMVLAALILVTLLVVPISMLRAAAPEMKTEPITQITATEPVTGSTPAMVAPAPITDDGTVETRVFPMAYPERVPEILKTLAGVLATYDTRTGSLVVRAPAEQMPRIIEQIHQLDPRQQVEVEACILDVSVNTDISAIFTPNAPVRTIITQLDQQQGVDLMSAPKVTVLSGKESLITVMQQVPTGFKELDEPSSYGPGIKLRVLPVVDGETMAYSIIISLTEEVTNAQAARSSARMFETKEILAKGSVKPGEWVKYDFGQSPGHKRVALLRFNLVTPDGQPAKSAAAAVQPNAAPAADTRSPNGTLRFTAASARLRPAAPDSIYEIPAIVAPLNLASGGVLTLQANSTSNKLLTAQSNAALSFQPAATAKEPPADDHLTTAWNGSSGMETYSPLVIRTIAGRGNQTGIDLNSGQLVKVPEGSDADVEKLRAAGVDIYFNLLHGGTPLTALDLVIVPMSDAAWGNTMPMAVRDLINKAREKQNSETVSPTQPLMDGTYAFSNHASSGGRFLGLLKVETDLDALKLGLHKAQISYRRIVPLSGGTVPIADSDKSDRMVLVAGEVAKPGHFVLPVDKPWKLSEAIQQAGGFNLWANHTITLVRHNQRNQPLQQIDMQAMAKTGDSRADVELHPGDTVFVPANEISSEP